MCRDSPDESQTGINVRVSPALLQDRGRGDRREASLTDRRNEASARCRELRIVDRVAPCEPAIEGRLDVDVSSNRSAAAERERLLEFQKHRRTMTGRFT